MAVNVFGMRGFGSRPASAVSAHRISETWFVRMRRELLVDPGLPETQLASSSPHQAWRLTMPTGKSDGVEPDAAKVWRQFWTSTGSRQWYPECSTKEPFELAPLFSPAAADAWLSRARAVEIRRTAAGAHPDTKWRCGS